MSHNKTCARCRATKPVGEFAAGTRWSDGLFPYCRECKRASDRASYARNREKRQPAKRAYYVRNADAAKARALASYRENPEVVKQRSAKWAAANPERRRKIRLDSQRRTYALNPERKREVWRRRHAAIKRGVAVYQFTSDQVAARVAYWGGRCWICRVAYEAIDHVKPLAKGGPHMLANLRPICTSCNTRKRDCWPLP
jgi:5-methylcytosine-specific restriction endonuclease McrA